MVCCHRRGTIHIEGCRKIVDPTVLFVAPITGGLSSRFCRRRRNSHRILAWHGVFERRRPLLAMARSSARIVRCPPLGSRRPTHASSCFSLWPLHFTRRWDNVDESPVRTPGFASQRHPG